MARTVLSDEEDDEIEVDEEEDPRLSSGGDDGDEGEDGLDQNKNDSFLADSDDEEENVGGEEEQNSDDGSRKKKRELEDFILDEDYYSFLHNNNVTGISGPKPGNQFKRLKKAGVDELLARRKQGLEGEASYSGELRAKRLQDEFEPFIFEEKSMTTNELPERIHLYEELTGDPPTDNTMIEEESSSLSWPQTARLISFMLSLLLYNLIIFDIAKDYPRDINPDMENFSIVYGDESVPRLYENSRISSYQLPGHSGIVKRAVALGRYLQNPLAMIATLCGPGKEILSWKLHALEHFLTPDEKYEVVEQVMVDATNQIGFDINLAISHEWHFSTLQFIVGLGPHKASALKKDLVREGSIYSRKDLVEPLGRKVFMNASGFLRVRRSGTAAASAQIIDVFEDTRIHPESYVLAKKLAKDIYAEFYADGAPHEMDDDEEELVIERLIKMPYMVRLVYIDEYIKSISEEYRKRETLRDIQAELLCGFSGWRTPYTEPRPFEEFWMLSGETEDTVSVGRIVQVTVCNIQENKVICMFDSGLKAIVMADDFSDEGFDPESSQLHEGDVLTGKIWNLDKNRFTVHLTCKASEMKGIPPFSRRDRDPYYHEQAMTSHTAQDKARKQKELGKKHFQPPMIVHPHFKSLTAEEAMQFLSDKEPGEKVIRTSSRGPSFFTLTLKIADGIYAHKDISEGGKDHKDIMLRQGKALTINNETFEDLNEVIDRFVDPLVGHLKSMLSYRKFRMELKNEVDEILREEKAKNPMKIAYSFGISQEHPGTFILSYIRGTNPHHEYVGLFPKGFRFRKRDFDNIDRLVSYFLKNIDKPPPVGPSIRNVTAMVPMKSSARGSSGRRFDSRNSSGGHGQGCGCGIDNFDNDDNGGGGGNIGEWASKIGSSRGGLGTGGNSGSSRGGASTGRRSRF